MKKITLLLLTVLINFVAFSQEKKVAISPVFDREKEVSNMYKLMVRMSFTKAIANQPNYVALERTNVDKIIDEVKFQETGMVSDDEIKELGNMLGADYVCILEVASDNNQIVISASIVEIETGKVIKNDFIVSDLDNYKIETACKTLADKLFFSNKIYLDANWQPLPNSKGAKYYRIVDFINETNRAKVRDYYMKGQIQMEGEGIFNDKSNLADDIMDGEFTFFDKKGNTTEISNYKNGKLNGKSMSFYESGNYNQIRNYDNGVLNGRFVSFYDEFGKKQYEALFSNGKTNGLAKSWYPNGKLKFEIEIVNNEPNGSVKAYYENGQVKTVGNAKNGFFDGYVTTYYDDGSIQFEGNLKMGRAEGYCNLYDEYGNKYSYNFSNGVTNTGQKAILDRIDFDAGF